MADYLHTPLSGLARLSNARSRSISYENVTGEKGRGGMMTIEEGHAESRRIAELTGTKPAPHAAVDLGTGWKIAPAVMIAPGETFLIADIDGPGAIQQMWLTGLTRWRFAILRMYWDDQEQPSVECPYGDFFGMGWGTYAPLVSLPVCVNPAQAFNCYWEMPFRRRARITLENIADEPQVLFYQVNYELRDVPDDSAYFHAQFRRVNPVPYKDVYTVLDGVRGQGHYAGTYVAWGSNNNGWWGEGEIKFFLDGDGEWPTICGTGTEDYFCGSHGFDIGLGPGQNPGYQEYTTPYAGLHQVIRPDGHNNSQQRFGMYRWHITDPVRFQEDLRITLQALGWRTAANPTFLALQDDLASVAYWYQTLPTAPFPQLPQRDELEVI
jgi:hypothetical protein